eukprot:g533.t1
MAGYKKIDFDELACAVRFYIETVPNTKPKKTTSEKPKKMKQASRKLRILCLHGYGQNLEGFRKKTGALRKFVKSHAEFSFFEAKTPLPECDHSITHGLDTTYAWWTMATGEDGKVDERGHGYRYLGWEMSIDDVQDFVDKEGPFDGVLGFSQGASMTSLLCSDIGPNRKRLDVKFGIFFSGFLVRDLELLKELKKYQESKRAENEHKH